MRRVFLFIILLTLSLLPGCSNNSLESEDLKENDQLSGEYEIKGTQINQRVCSPPYFRVYDCEPGEPLESDTVQTSFLVSLQFMEQRKDTVMFTGLEGADADIKYHRDANHLPTPSMTECLTKGNPDYDCAYAKLTNEKLTFNLSQFSAYYLGEGTLRDGILQLETAYSYRGAVVKYSLEGEKVDE